MDILRGSAMTSRTGLVVDLFQFTDGEQFFARNADGPARFEALLRDVVGGHDDIETRLWRKEDGLGHRRTRPRVAPSVHVDNEQSPTYTIIELVATDAPGLLHRVGRLLSRHGCDVELVLISTEGSRAIDVFHLTRAGGKLDAAVCEAVCADLGRFLAAGV
jgi:[protein-PII] uridylyltransferase